MTSPSPPATGRRAWLGWFAAAVAAGAAGCAGPGQAVEPDHRAVDPPQPPGTGDRVEVIEFFWYGCPHCAALHRPLRDWAARQPPDVALEFRPAMLAERWASGAAMHFVLAQLGEAERLGERVFEDVQLQALDLSVESSVFDWAASQGLDRERFVQAWQSAPVAARVRQARAWTVDYGLTGVPALVVDGRWLTSNRYTGSNEETLRALDRLVERARQARRAPR